MSEVPRSSRASQAQAESQRLWRLAAMGGTMASEILAGVLLGWLADQIFKTSPTWVVVGAITGVVIGMVTFIRSAVRESGRAGSQATRIARERNVAPLPDEPPDEPPSARDEHDARDELGGDRP